MSDLLLSRNINPTVPLVIFQNTKNVTLMYGSSLMTCSITSRTRNFQSPVGIRVRPCTILVQYAKSAFVTCEKDGYGEEESRDCADAGERGLLQVFVGPGWKEEGERERERERDKP